MRFHLMTMRPGGPASFYTRAFNEVIETLAYGLVALGHQVSHRTNTFVTVPGATNIVLGPQFVDASTNFPAGTILYNLEQIGGNPNMLMSPELSQRYIIWDYSPVNLAYWREHGIEAQLVPVGYVPQLTRIRPVARPDIDVLFYGSLNARRKKIIDALQQDHSLSVTVAQTFGEPRDLLIARAKIILNLHYYDKPQLFEQPRVSYLLSNFKAVVSEKSEDFPAALHDALWEVDYDDLPRACHALVHDVDERLRLQKRGFELFSRMRETHMLAPALKRFSTETCPAACAPSPSGARA
jgi:hypothetical protein